MKYTVKLRDKIVELYATGNHTIPHICDAVGINPATYHRWKQEKSDFCDLLKEADERRIDSIANLALSGLAKLCSAYEYEEVTTEMKNIITRRKDDKGNEILVDNPKKVAEKKVTKKIMPSATAVIFALTNTAPESWKHKNHTDVSSGGKSFFDLLKEASEKNHENQADEE